MKYLQDNSDNLFKSLYSDTDKNLCRTYDVQIDLSVYNKLYWQLYNSIGELLHRQLYLIMRYNEVLSRE